MRPLLLASFLAFSWLASAEQQNDITGKVLVPAPFSLGDTVLILHTALGEERRTFVDVDGSFTFHDVPPGVHQLQPSHIKLIYPEVRLEVHRKRGVVRASMTHNRQLVLPSPLLIRPAAEAQYYEKRKPFDVWSFIKSPYGLMIVFSLFAIVVFPRLKMDPEDYKEFQQQIGTGAGAGAAQGGAGQGGQARLRERGEK